MKKILVLALLLTAFNVKSQTKYETEKWLAEKMFAYSTTPHSDIRRIESVVVQNCEILVRIGNWDSDARRWNYGQERISVSAILSFTDWHMGVENAYQFKGNIKAQWRPNGEVYNISSSNLMLIKVPDEMIERIQNALEHYRKLCGINEPF